MSYLNRRLTASAVAVGLFGLAVLTGCGTTATTSTSTMSPAASPAAVGSAAPQPMAGASVDGLLGVVNNTKTAVEANDFPKAKSAFEQFEGAWKPVEDGIKAKSPDGYEKIEGSMDQVMAALKSSDQQKGLTALQSLTEQINSVK